MYLLCTQQLQCVFVPFCLLFVTVPPMLLLLLKMDFILRFWRYSFSKSDRKPEHSGLQKFGTSRVRPVGSEAKLKISESRNVEKFTGAKEVQKASKSPKVRRLRKFESSIVR